MEREYPNDEETVYLEIGESTYELKRHNTEIYRFLGEYAIQNHIYHAPDDTELSVYFFEYIPEIRKLAEYLIERTFPTHLNIIEPLKTDTAAFEDMIAQEVDLDIEEFREKGFDQ